MPSRKNFSPQGSHTVVLQPRGNSASQQQKYGSKQTHLTYARGSPPQVMPRAPNRQTRLPTEHTPRRRNIPEANHRESVDLLVRFGIDSILGRVVTRILILFMLTQPVYIALGMEIEEPASEGNTPPVEEISEETITVEDVIEINEQKDETSEPEESDVVTETDTATETETETVVEEGDDESVDVDTDLPAQTDVETTETDTTEQAEEVTEGTETQDSGTESEETTEEGGDETDVTEDENTDDTTGTEEESGDETTDTEGGDTDTTIGSGGGGGGSSSNTEEETDDSEETTASSTDDFASSTDETASSTDETTENTTDTSDDTDTDTASTTASSTASTTEKTDDTVLNIAQNPDSKYIFGEGDCTLVSDGEFYCVSEGPETQLMTGDERVYSEKDREGDKEIFYFDGIDVNRITNNSYDDFAPMYDEETKYIVWQSMIQDRLQVMVYEIETKTTRQITTSRQNSSNPSIAGHTVVWQEWIDTNWEIMMTDVDNDGQKFEIERLTDNAVHDMFPAAYEDLITWQSERGSSWEVVVYDLHTGKQTLIEKDEDTKYENPRFVLLFDSKHENGDVETIGYDLDTGEMMELGTRSQPIPLEPLTPNEETPEALLREASTSTQIKVEETDEEEDESSDVVVM